MGANGIVYYLNGEKMLTYPAAMTFPDTTGTTKDFVDLFLLAAAKEGVIFGTKQYKGEMDTENTIVEGKELTEEEAKTRYENYLLEKAYYPTASHVWSTDTSSAMYDHCTVDGCGILNPEHGTEKYPHAYVTDQASANFDKCIACGEIHPEHGKTEAHPHVYVGTTCKVCGEANPGHTHSYVDGVCECGAREFSTTVDDAVYKGDLLPVVMKNNDTSSAWWNGSTNDITMKDYSATIITWENTRDKNFYDYAVELVFNLGGKVGDTPDGQFIDFDPTNQWTAEWESATAPTLDGSTSGEQLTAGKDNAGYGTYVATIIRTGTTVSVTVEFTANGSDTVTWTRTATATNCPTGDMVIRIAGNPYFLDNFAGWTGELASNE